MTFLMVPLRDTLNTPKRRMVAQKSTNPSTCPVLMRSDSLPCGRSIWQAPGSKTTHRFCLMHSEDDEKAQHNFQAEISAIISGTSAFNRVANVCDFTGFVFPVSNFSGHVFKSRMIFNNAKFMDIAQFDQIRFLDSIDFASCVFRRKCVFSNSVFEKETNFFGAQFSDDAFFAICKFLAESDFGYTLFDKNAYFKGSRFVRALTFYSANFNQNADFTSVTVGANLALELAALPNAPQSAPADSVVVDFRNATFIKPSDVIFCQVNAGAPNGLRVRFANCRGLEKVTFEDVNWNGFGRRRIVLQDELDIRDAANGSESNYELVASAYRRLVTNFDRTRHFDLSEDCFCGALEMKRLDPRHLFVGRFRRVESFYRRHRFLRSAMSCCSVLNLYRVLSNYGSSYLQAAAILVAMFILFTVLYPLLGLQMHSSITTLSSQGGPTDTKPTAIPAESFTWTSAKSANDLFNIFGAGLWATVDQFTFRKSQTVEPVTKWGRRLALVEMILTPGQLALVLLALRRRLRR